MKKSIFLFSLFLTSCFWKVHSDEALPALLDESGRPTAWLLCGPFPNVQCEGFTKDFLTSAGGEEAIVPREGMEHESSMADGGRVRWKPIRSPEDGIIDLVEPLSGKNDVVGYAFCFIPSQEDLVASIELGSDDGVRLWINDRLVHDNHLHRGLNPTGDTVIVRLRKGWNRCLVKVDQGTGGWAFALRVGKAVKEGEIHCTIEPGRFLVRGDDGSLMQRAMLRILNTAGETEARAEVSLQGKVFPADLGKLPFGWSLHQIGIPNAESPVPATLTLKTGEGERKIETVITPARKWEIYIVQHTHTDIGYTHLQTEIFERHGKYIREALELCKKTDDYPAGSKFKWVCETFLTVEKFLETATQEEIDEFVRRINEGRVEVAAHYLNGTDLECAEELVRKTYFAMQAADKYGFQVTTAMNDDINGLSWATPSVLARCGVKYLSMGVNYTRSIPVLERPNAFWWEGPDGSKILVWNAEHYMFGNFTGLHDRLELVEEKLPPYLAELEKKGYPFNILGFKMSGFITDNSPPNLKPCDIVREWNVKYAYPRLILATSREWFQRLEKEHAKEIPRYKLAWPDWWADGHASSAFETMLTRETHEVLFTAERFSALGKILDPSFPYPADRFRQTLKKVMLYDEHTWGASQSISQPDAEETRGQWKIKASYATEPFGEAIKLLGESLAPFARGGSPSLFEREGALSGLGAVNSLPWERSGIVLFPIFTSAMMRSIQRNQMRVEDPSTGGDLPYQFADTLISMNGRCLWVFDKIDAAEALRSMPDGVPTIAMLARDVPPTGYRGLVLKGGIPSFERKSSVTISGNKISNRFFEVALDPVTGGISSIFDKELKRELVDQRSPYKLNQYIYELPAGGRQAINTGRKDPPIFERVSPVKAEISPGANGPLLGSIVSRTASKNTPEIVQEVILYDFDKRIDIRNRVNKEEVLDAEGAYYAFPFAVHPFRLKAEISLAIMEPGEGQLPGSSSDWHCIQRWADFSNEDFGITWVTRDAPLVQFSRINSGKWQKRLELENPAVFSWIMNNYWFTNFKASQGGRLTFRYSITTHRGPCKNSAAMKFAQERANPLLFGPAPNPRRSFLRIDDPQVVLLAFKQAERGKDYVLRLWNCEEKPTKARVVFPEFQILSAHAADIVERKGRTIPHGKNSVEIPMKGFDIATVILGFKKK